MIARRDSQLDSTEADAHNEIRMAANARTFIGRRSKHNTEFGGIGDIYTSAQVTSGDRLKLRGNSTFDIGDRIGDRNGLLDGSREGSGSWRSLDAHGSLGDDLTDLGEEASGDLRIVSNENFAYLPDQGAGRSLRGGETYAESPGILQQGDF